jgi:hypothetical protein
MSDTIKINDPEVAVLSETKAGVFVPVFDLTETEPADQFKSIELSTIVEDAVTQALDQNNDAQPLIYKALITQSGEDAPTLLILKNTIGEIVWTRSMEGVYLGTLTGAFAENKVFTMLYGAFISDFNRSDNNSVRIITYSGDFSESAMADGLLSETPILIEVYP